MKKENETDIEMLARLMAEGFGQMNVRFDAIERKQDGMPLSLDETVHRSEFIALTQRVEALEA